MKQVYYQLKLTQLAPMRISGGNIYESGTTDLDILTDGRGLPYIPGSALAGVLRSMLTEQDAKDAFGYIDQEKKEIRASRVTVSDAVLKDGTGVRKSIRDGVRLNDDGTVVDTGKYDYEVVESTKAYTAILETSDEMANGILEKLLSTVVKHGLSVGGRTSRGFGELSVSVFEKSFVLPKDTNAWVKWDPFAETAFAETDAFKPVDDALSGTQTVYVEADLEVIGTLMIRVPREGDKVNYEGLRNAENKAVIPGTTWAGVLRHHMRKLAREVGWTDAPEKINALFGIDNEEDAQYSKSKLFVSETTLEGSRAYDYTRNALDRFTMAPRNSALYAERILHGGTGTIKLRIPAEGDPQVLSLLMAAIQDLHNGLVPLGGEGNVGRGRIRFSRMTVNEEDCMEALNRCDLIKRAEEVCARG